jgi:YVTN family beta-propeller protein
MARPRDTSLMVARLARPVPVLRLKRAIQSRSACYAVVAIVLAGLTIASASLAVPLAGPATLQVQSIWTSNRAASTPGPAAPSAEATTRVGLGSVGAGYLQTFTETGLPSGTTWNVTMAGQTESGPAGSGITFTEPNGTFSYSLGGPFGYQPVGGAPAFSGVLHVPSSSDTRIGPGIGVYSEPAGIAYDPANGFLYLVDSDDRNVSVINGSTNALVVPAIAVGPSPIAIAYDPVNGDIYVADEGNNFVTVINASTNSVIIPALIVGDGPDGVVYDAATGNVWVANYGTNNLTEIDSSTNKVIVPGIPVGNGPMGMAFDVANGYIYVANFGSDNVTVVDGATNMVVNSGIPVGTEPDDVAYDSWNNCLFVVNFEATGLTVINGTTDEVIAPSIGVGPGPGNVAFDPSNGFLYVTDSQANVLTIINGATNRIVSQRVPVGDLPFDIAYDEANGYLYVTNAGSDNVTVMDGNGGVASIWQTAPTYPVSLTETGLPSGAQWGVVFDGVAKNASAGDPISFSEPNGSYRFEVTGVAGYTTAPTGGELSVFGWPTSVTVAYTANTAGTGFLGLPGDTGYLLIAGVVAVTLTSGAVGFWAGRRGGPGGLADSQRSGPPSGASP